MGEMVELPGFDLGHGWVLLPVPLPAWSRVDRGGLDFKRLEDSAEVMQNLREVGAKRIQGKRSSINRGVVETLRDHHGFREVEAMRLHVVRHITVPVRSDRDPGRLR